MGSTADIAHQNGPATAANDPAAVYSGFSGHCGANRVETGIALMNILRKTYPDQQIRCVTAGACNLLQYAKYGKAVATQIAGNESQLLETAYTAPLSRLSGELGTLTEGVKFGAYEYTWNESKYFLYYAEWIEGQCTVVQKQYIVHPKDDSVKETLEKLLIAAGNYCAQVHHEVYVFDMGNWSKNTELWRSVQSASWDDVILEPKMKQGLIDDIQGFFDDKQQYNEFGVPWKRGVIFHGLPGNGKTISIKAIMHELDSRPVPIPSLYVKSLEGFHGHHYYVRLIFEHARRSAPCLLIFEDLDSLVTDKVRSYFLNEVDGIENNEGILMVGSTNHLSKLDPAISKRPSRFDRKFHFQVPGETERKAYCEFWQKKLAKNESVDFPEEVCGIVAKLTDGFSFAYMKELFITSLLALFRGQIDVENEVTSGAQEEQAAVAEINGEVNDAPGEAKEEEAKEEVVKSEPIAVVEIPESLKSNVLLRVLQGKVSTLRGEMDNSNDTAEAEGTKEKKSSKRSKDKSAA